MAASGKQEWWRRVVVNGLLNAASIIGGGGPISLLLTRLFLLQLLKAWLRWLLLVHSGCKNNLKDNVSPNIRSRSMQLNT